MDADAQFNARFSEFKVSHTEQYPVTPRATPRPDTTVDRATFLTENEGVRLGSYADSEGVRTVGVGFNLDRADAKEKIEALGLDFDKVYAGTQELTDENAQALFKETMAEAEDDAKEVFSNFDELSDNRQTALVDMMFNLGQKKWLTFKNSIKNIEDGDFDAFVKRGKGSTWAKQVGKRADRVLKLIEQG